MTRLIPAFVLIPAALIAAGLQTVPATTQTVSGIVTRADANTPLPGARIELVREDYKRLSTGFEKPCKPEPKTDLSEKRRFAFSDSNGKFTFPEVENGAYYLFAEREGFLKVAYGQHGRYPIPRVLHVGIAESTDESFSPRHSLPRSTGSGRLEGAIGRESISPRDRRNTSPTTAVVPGQTGAIVDYTSPAKIDKSTLHELKLSLTPAPTIAGMVVDEKGTSRAAAVVQLYQLRYTPLNGRTLKSVRATITDDEGKYRMFWLDPGRYLASAGYSEYGLQPWAQGLRLTSNVPAADSGYPMMFYPTAAAASDALYIALNPGAQPIVDFKLRSRPRLKLGIRLTGEAVPANTSLVFTPAGGDLCAAADYGIAPQKNGIFEIRDVPEGLYVAAAMSGRDFISDLQTVNVEKGRPIDVRLPVTAPVTVRGTVYFENAPQEIDLSSVRVSLMRKGQDTRQIANAIVDPKTGRFAIEGLGPGTYYPTVDLPPGLYVDNVGASRFDINDKERCSDDRAVWSPAYKYLDPHGHLDASQALTIPQTLPLGAECLAIKVQLGKPLFGFVYDRVDRVVSGALVVAIPKGIWAKSGDAGATPADRILTATTDETGFFILDGLTNSLYPDSTLRQEYHLFAFESIDPNEMYNPGLPDRFQNRESFEARLFLYIDGGWKQRGNASLDFAMSDTCDTYDQFARKVCFLIAIPAADTADMQ